MLFDCRIDHLFAESPQTVERSNVVQADQTAITSHVGIHDGNQLTPIWWPPCQVRRVGSRHSGQPHKLSPSLPRESRRSYGTLPLIVAPVIRRTVSIPWRNALLVTWVSIEIHTAAGKRTYYNSFGTDLDVNAGNVAELAACDRARWTACHGLDPRIENETFNVLKTNG